MDKLINIFLKLGSTLPLSKEDLEEPLFVRNIKFLTNFSGKGKPLSTKDLLEVVPQSLLKDWVEGIINKGQISIMTCPEADIALSLKKLREHRKVSRKDLSLQTNISLETIKALEEGLVMLGNKPILLSEVEVLVSQLGGDVKKIHIYPLI
jgi:hypothetical protein